MPTIKTIADCLVVVWDRNWFAASGMALRELLCKHHWKRGNATDFPSLRVYDNPTLSLAGQTKRIIPLPLLPVHQRHYFFYDRQPQRQPPLRFELKHDSHPGSGNDRTCDAGIEDCSCPRPSRYSAGYARV